MGPITVTLVASASVRELDPVARFFDPVAASWPAGWPKPAARPLPLDSLALHLLQPENTGMTAHLAPLLIVLGPEVQGPALAKLVDQLQRCLLPAVVLVPRADASVRRLQSHGVIIDDHGASPAMVAAMLLAFAERQSTVLELSREVSIHTRFEGGMRGEIDRMHDELNLAATVQQELLPRSLPSIGCVQFAALFRPVGYVSGDIYDVVRLDERHVGFFIADAVGHGVPAALLTMVIARSLKMMQLCERTGELEIVPPGEAMSRLNDELCRGQRENTPRFSTAVYGVIDTVSRRVRLVGAGHPPPLRVRASASHTPGVSDLTRVETDGPLLGVFPGERFTEVEFTLDQGETLLLYSDGFETAFAPPEFAPADAHRRRSADSYLGELASLRWPDGQRTGVSAAETLDQLERRINAQSGSLHQIDDVTALAISAMDVECESSEQGEAARAA